MRKKLQQKIGNSKNIPTSQYLNYYTQNHLNDGAITLYNIENYVSNSVKKINNSHNILAVSLAVWKSMKRIYCKHYVLLEKVFSSTEIYIWRNN